MTTVTSLAFLCLSLSFFPALTTPTLLFQVPQTPLQSSSLSLSLNMYMEYLSCNGYMLF